MKRPDLDTRRDHDFSVLLDRPARHDAIGRQPDELHGDLPLAHSLRALFSLFGDQQNGQMHKI